MKPWIGHPAERRVDDASTVTGTADEPERELPATLVNFVSAHLELSNTLDRAKAEMDAAAKTAQAEARSKAKTTAKKELPKPETTTLTDTPKPAQPVKGEPSKTASLFHAPALPAIMEAELDEEEEILAEIAIVLGALCLFPRWAGSLLHSRSSFHMICAVIG